MSTDLDWEVVGQNSTILKKNNAKETQAAEALTMGRLMHVQERKIEIWEDAWKAHASLLELVGLCIRPRTRPCPIDRVVESVKCQRLHTQAAALPVDD
ncbi:hypothetical protein PC110_g19210 [Phytophthora cactorum]|uniref:Uncharacterized protein n=1 Tax=Phytophthora cactorum TaxID=29920 RepID=A0A329RIW0_9STRA|nr:hypothetical protein PC110_g19210 [Phytophthora cactorum]